jgi:hypothetical protein
MRFLMMILAFVLLLPVCLRAQPSEFVGRYKVDPAHSSKKCLSGRIDEVEITMRGDSLKVEPSVDLSAYLGHYFDDINLPGEWVSAGSFGGPYIAYRKTTYSSGKIRSLDRTWYWWTLILVAVEDINLRRRSDGSLQYDVRDDNNSFRAQCRLVPL